MRAIWFDGKRLGLRSLKTPEPKRTEALVKVHYAGICNTDLEIFKGYMNFIGVPGHEFVGTVVKGPKQWLGKRVVGEINLSCEKCSYCQSQREPVLKRHCPNRTVLGILNKNGAFAEYLTLPLKNLHEIPNSVSDLKAVFVEPLAAALRILSQVQIKKNQQILLLGDGKLAQLIARVLRLKTKNLTVIGKHPEKLALLNPLGIKTLLLNNLGKIHWREKPEIVIEATGDPSGIELALELCKPTGTIIVKSTFHQKVQLNLSKLVVDELSLVGSRCGDFPQAIYYLAKRRISLDGLVNGVYLLEDFPEAFEKAMSSNSLKIIFKCLK